MAKLNLQIFIACYSIREESFFLFPIKLWYNYVGKTSTCDAIPNYLDKLDQYETQ